jgi:hypothetical protein
MSESILYGFCQTLPQLVFTIVDLFSMDFTIFDVFENEDNTITVMLLNPLSIYKIYKISFDVTNSVFISSQIIMNL